MNTKFQQLASLLAFIIGAMAVFAGGRVLLGNDPGYYVINWLVIYNYTIGILSVFLTAILIWKNSRLALPAAVFTLSANMLVMLILLTMYRDVVAPDSIMAMTIRIIIWIAITILLLVQSKRSKAVVSPKATV